jgi:hypothetical protein
MQATRPSVCDRLNRSRFQGGGSSGRPWPDAVNCQRPGPTPGTQADSSDLSRAWAAA